MTTLDDRASAAASAPADAPAPSAIIRETHTSYVFLLGDVAYKMKKPVRTEFLDFSTVDARWWACEREFTLNSRFAPDVYIGIAELSDPLGGPAEPLLKMRRLPDSTRLSTLALAGRDLTTELQVIARTVASVHRDSLREPRIDSAGTSDAVSTRWRNNIDELRALAAAIVPDEMIDALERSSSRYIAGRTPLFASRVSHGRIVDGHGDLLADDIFCLDDGPRILDCLDFDDLLRFVDGIDDACCLAMDLRFHGRADAAEQFLNDYLEAASDDPPRSLIDHYVAYRAAVRAKVACIRFLQGDIASKSDALAHIDLALAHTNRSTVTMTLVGGLPGTGKTTLSRAVGAETSAVVLSSDVVRKELAGLDPLDAHPDNVDEGLYDPAATVRTYTELLRRASEHLAMGRSVILDASWTDAAAREQATLSAESAGAQLVELECTVPRSIAVDRIARRGRTPSDATAQVYRAMACRRAPWPSASEVDTTGPTNTTTRVATALIARRQAS